MSRSSRGRRSFRSLFQSADARRLDDLLDGRSGSDDDVARLLHVARAPSGPEPTTGLDIALAEYRAAQPVARSSRRAQVWRRVAATTLTTKIVAVITATAATAGIAVASTRGSGPAHPPPTPAPTVSPSAGRNAPSSGSAPAATGHRSSGPTGSSSAPSSASPTVSDVPTSTTTTSPLSSLTGLCRTWLADPAKRTELAQSRAFQALVSAAGGADKVTTFCTARLSPSPGRTSRGKSHGPATTLPGTLSVTPPDRP